MVWTPHTGNPSWKLGTCNQGDPLEEDDYCDYNYFYEDHFAERSGAFIGSYSWGLIDIQFEAGNGSPYLKIDTHFFDKPGQYDRIVNSQIINTNTVHGQIVTLNDYYQPSGSYRASCQDVSGEPAWNNGVLTQQCKSENGDWMYTKLDYSKECASDSSVSNENGHLVCDVKRYGQSRKALTKTKTPPIAQAGVAFW